MDEHYDVLLWRRMLRNGMQLYKAACRVRKDVDMVTVNDEIIRGFS